MSRRLRAASCQAINHSRRNDAVEVDVQLGKRYETPDQARYIKRAQPAIESTSLGEWARGRVGYIPSRSLPGSLGADPLKQVWTNDERLV